MSHLNEKYSPHLLYPLTEARHYQDYMMRLEPSSRQGDSVGPQTTGIHVSHSVLPNLLQSFYVVIGLTFFGM